MKYCNQCGSTMPDNVFFVPIAAQRLEVQI